MEMQKTMALKISLWIAVIVSFIHGMVTLSKFYNCISHSELFLLVFLRVLGTFIIFFASGLGIYFFLKQQIPSRVKRPVSSKMDYVLPSISPTSAVIADRAEIKEKLPEADETKASAEALAMTIRTMLAQE
ncbi:MAG: hypothetical protein QME42_10155 [bacterium]|nr:hypothetical protein [bacterium]